MAIDKANILAAKAAVEAYYQAHDALHAGVWSKDIPEAHTPLVTKLAADLQAQGFGSIQEFTAAEKALAAEEFSQGLVTLSLAAGAPVRFLDISGLTMDEGFALRYVSRELRRKDDIADTIHFRYSRSPVPIVAYTNSEVGARAKNLGIATLDGKTQSTYPHRSSYLWQDEVFFGTTTMGRFTTLAEAKTAQLALCVQALSALGVSGLSATPAANNIKLGNRKLASTQGVEYDENGVWAKPTPNASSRVLTTLVLVTLDFDYNLAAQVFADPGIRDKVITLKEILGRDATPEELKSAFLEAVTAVFGKPATMDSLNQVELGVINGH